MKTATLDHIAKFFYDCGKISFAVLVIGVIAHKPLVAMDLLWGVVMTLIFFGLGVIIDEVKSSEA